VDNKAVPGFAKEKEFIRMKVLLLAGGNSSEAAVSINSGRAIYDALKRLGHDVLAIDPAGGKSLVGSDGNYLPQAAPTSTAVTAAPGSLPALTFGPANLKDVSVVLIALHGGEGENGTIQCLLDLSGMKYTGSGMAASAIAMNKAITKRLLATVDVPTPDWKLYQYRSAADAQPIKSDLLSQFKYPFIIKPNESGSTVGLTKVKEESEIIPALASAAGEGPGVLVEEFISGREITAAVLDGHAFPLVEIRPKNELYDYEAKYTKGKSEYLAPAPLDAATTTRIQEAGLRAYQVIGASGLARVDFILQENGTFHCLEINTLPGMTNLSLAPMAAKCEGIDFDTLIDKLIQSAINK
jgi:D-alanine-D-alanine ligase